MNEVAESTASALTQRAAGALAHLPEPVQTGFWRAAGRLVGGALATPAAWLRRPAQAVEDKTDAQSLVTRRIAEAVAERAAADPAVLERAMESLVREEFRKQNNKEKVVENTAHSLGQNTAEPPAGRNIDEDWMNVFVRYAEDASTDRMQQLWGRVLAGEIRRPGAFSLSTIRFLSELDSRVAGHFERISPFLVGDDLFRSEERLSGEQFSLLLELVSAGLLTTGDFLSRTITANDQGLAHVVGVGLGLQARTKPGTTFNFPIATLTRLGKEISALVSKGGDENQELRKIAKYLWDQNSGQIETISLVRIIRSGQNAQALPIEQLHSKPSGGASI